MVFDKPKGKSSCKTEEKKKETQTRQSIFLTATNSLILEVGTALDDLDGGSTPEFLAIFAHRLVLHSGAELNRIIIINTQIDGHVSPSEDVVVFSVEFVFISPNSAEPLKNLKNGIALKRVSEWCYWMCVDPWNGDA